MNKHYLTLATIIILFLTSFQWILGLVIITSFSAKIIELFLPLYISFADSIFSSSLYTDPLYVERVVKRASDNVSLLIGLTCFWLLVSFTYKALYFLTENKPILSTSFITIAIIGCIEFLLFFESSTIVRSFLALAIIGGTLYVTTLPEKEEKEEKEKQEDEQGKK